MGHGLLFDALIYLSAAVIAVPLSLFLGLLAALYRDSILDKLN